MKIQATIVTLLPFIIFAGMLRAQELIPGTDNQSGISPSPEAVIQDRDELIIYDLSQLTWLESFDSLHALLSERYAFTQWKELDWPFKKSISRPKVELSQNEGNILTYSAALFEYLLSVPDGHIMMMDQVKEFIHTMQAGSFGLNMLPISDGSVVANMVPKWGQAYQAGIRCGDQIISWNGVAMADIPELEVYNNPGGMSSNYATLEGRMISRYAVLGRDSVGALADITYVSHATGTQHNVVLTAVSDTFNLANKAHQLTAPVQDSPDPVFYKIIEGKEVGYLHVADEDVPDTLTREEIRQTQHYLLVKEAITYFNANSIDKLVFDLRENHGGNDLLGATIAGFFVDAPMFYEYITGSVDDGFAITDTIITVPESPYFDGEIVVMVGPNNISTGEGIPMILQQLPNARVASFWGTNGSFGIVPEVVVMADSMQLIMFPYARSLNENEQIQLDSDADMVGGVQPDIRIPVTVERVIDQWVYGKDVELEYGIGILLDVPEFEAEEQWMIYPNPTSGKFFFKHGSPDPVSLVIHDLSGNVVQCIDHATPCSPIDISGLNPGLYFIKTSNLLGVQACKLLVY